MTNNIIKSAPDTITKPEHPGPEAQHIESFGQWVKAWREYRGISMSEMARRAGWDAQYQNLLEKELRRKKDGSSPMPREETVKMVAHILNISERDALLAAGYAPLDIRRTAYLSAPQRSADGSFVFLNACNSANASTQFQEKQSSGENAPPKRDEWDWLIYVVEELKRKSEEHDCHFRKLEEYLKAGTISSCQHLPTSQAQLPSITSKDVSPERTVSNQRIG